MFGNLAGNFPSWTAASSNSLRRPAERSSCTPDIPTFAEKVSGPASTPAYGRHHGAESHPDVIVAKPTQNVEAVLKMPATVERLKRLRTEITVGTPAEFTARLKFEPSSGRRSSRTKTSRRPRNHAHDRIQGRVGRTIYEAHRTGRLPRPRKGAPNVVFILLDDVGFAHLGCYGSTIETPNMDRLAAGGLRYTNFHTTAMCSPTRAALLTGRNHHAVGMRGARRAGHRLPGLHRPVTKRAATLAEMLRPSGYTTFAVGKWHLTPIEQTSPAGPFDHWPLPAGSIASTASSTARPTSGARSCRTTTTRSSRRDARRATT